MKKRDNFNFCVIKPRFNLSFSLTKKVVWSLVQLRGMELSASIGADSGRGGAGKFEGEVRKTCHHRTNTRTSQADTDRYQAISRGNIKGSAIYH